MLSVLTVPFKASRDPQYAVARYVSLSRPRDMTQANTRQILKYLSLRRILVTQQLVIPATTHVPDMGGGRGHLTTKEEVAEQAEDQVSIEVYLMVALPAK